MKTPMMQWRVAVTLALMTVLPLSVIAQGNANEPLQVFGNTTTIELAPVLVAVERGIYAGPAKISNGGIPNLWATPNGGVLAEVTTNAETQALRQSLLHPDLRIILTVSDGLYRIVGKRSAGITRLADLKGKKIGTIPNTSSAYFLHKMLGTVGLSDADVTVVPLTALDKYKTALTEQGLDAITIWEPGADYAVESVGNDAIEFSGKGIYREAFNLNTTAAALADPVRRARIVGFVRALITASDQLNKNPQLAWPLVAKSSGYAEAVVQHAWPHHAYPAKPAADLLDVMAEEDKWVARETTRAPRTREQLATLIDDSVYRDAIKP
ncbi:MAG TPA: ABC transporter substrate-binding protein [Candidatus Acidoferrum sp.]|nr:ABC transporter substrate-binding protein [Candidatus Acidoferrum sp.]